MTETAARPQDANGHRPVAVSWCRTPSGGEDPGPVTAGLEPPVVTAVRFMNLFEIIAHLAGRISHLESRIDEAGIPYRPDLLPDAGSFENCYSADYGVCPSVTGRTR